MNGEILLSDKPELSDRLEREHFLAQKPRQSFTYTQHETLSKWVPSFRPCWARSLSASGPGVCWSAYYLSETERKQKELEDCKKARDDAQLLHSKLEDEELEYRNQFSLSLLWEFGAAVEESARPGLCRVRKPSTLVGGGDVRFGSVQLLGSLHLGLTPSGSARVGVYRE
ncbi:hypothetical protein B296_00054545 [Ensete ventricosum]|uniref:Uncharacterized protein n=1 Tax=Ensete ventricosum TaxID=4639 RepID=A0A426Y074_ENSVE|nr:hypothetical protein B296_00054545 [Ensete ventricosum]